jgi:hypothetical protein
MGERTLVIIASDAHDWRSQYFLNFIWRVQQALAAAKIEARIVVAADAPDP